MKGRAGRLSPKTVWLYSSTPPFEDVVCPEVEGSYTKREREAVVLLPKSRSFHIFCIWFFSVHLNSYCTYRMHFNAAEHCTRREGREGQTPHIGRKAFENRV